VQVEQRMFVVSLKFDECQKQIIAHGYPDLCQDGILGGAQEGFNLEILFDPLEKDLNLPARFIDLSNS